MTKKTIEGVEDYQGAAAGWGALKAVADALRRPLSAQPHDHACCGPNATLTAVTDQSYKQPAYLALHLLDPRLERRKVRRVAGARHHAQKIFA